MISGQKKKKFNPLLLNVLIISAVFHAVGLFILGGITMVKYIIPDEAQFEEPPEIVEDQPSPPATDAAKKQIPISLVR